MRVVGVLGGMGPTATVDFVQRVIDATAADRDQDHLRVLVDSDPSVPDRSAFLAGRGPSPRDHLVRMAQGLERAGATLLVIPCNTAHVWLDEISSSVEVEVVDWVGEVVGHVESVGGGRRRVGLLATTGTVSAGLYQRAFESSSSSIALPSATAQASLMEVIYGPAGIKASSAAVDAPGVRTALREVAAELRDSGADSLLLACTELSVARDAFAETGIEVFDATQIVAEAVVVRAGKQPRERAVEDEL